MMGPNGEFVILKPVPNQARFNGNVATLFSFLIGFGSAMIVSKMSCALVGGAQHLAVQESAIIFAQTTRPASARQFIQQTKAQRLTQFAIRAAQANNAGTRDVSIKAQLMDELSKMDGATKAELLAAFRKQEMAGVIAPLGFFDPLGFSTECSVGRLLFYREAEIKHGRVGMLATLGLLVGEEFHPIFGGSLPAPSIEAFSELPMAIFWATVLFAIVTVEVYSAFTFEAMQPGSIADWKQNSTAKAIPDLILKGRGPFYTMPIDRVPGDFNWDPLGLKPKDPDEFKEMQSKELNNGRLAMLAAACVVASRSWPGASTWVYRSIPWPGR